MNNAQLQERVGRLRYQEKAAYYLRFGALILGAAAAGTSVGSENAHDTKAAATAGGVAVISFVTSIISSQQEASKAQQATALEAAQYVAQTHELREAGSDLPR